ncbi:2-succinyl-5-enolpyruvyl-6-hydroxy-3-cyclohexene-1-carboxylate synthase [bacterium]|nr:2-succinyl-5-enolpyruvyl-6-hydroxy-3-cyclohexene-1-carboxylate synthase [bacterium]
MKQNDYNTLHYLLAMLKMYEICDIVASPGAQNARFNCLAQYNDFFNCISVIDERSAGYVAIGIATEKHCPVVITCTGATASRNYMSALTEAFYRKIPIVAITFFNPETNKYSLSPQFVDRSVSQNDIKALSVELPICNNAQDISNCIFLINAALTTAKEKSMPVHINCPAHNDFENGNFCNLPENIWKTETYHTIDTSIKKSLINRSVAVYIGSHKEFSKEDALALSEFADSWKIPVLCDQTSGYKGKNKVMISQIASMLRMHEQKPDLIIDIGGICGEYSSKSLFKNTEVWRISEDKEFKARYNTPLNKLFFCSENTFFTQLKRTNENQEKDFYAYMKTIVDNITYPDLPLCNPLVCQQLAKYIPNNSSLHLAILNSLRSMNFFNLDKSIQTSCNVGGFGIDGPVSTIVGQSLCNPDKKYFGVIGDLAFFYDMNVLGQRDIKNNLRLLVVNNNGGFEFRVKTGAIEQNMKNDAEKLISASNHNKGGVRGWAESCNYEYMSARTKQEFMDKIQNFCQNECDKPIIFEVFINVKEEQDGLELMQMSNRDKFEESAINLYKNLKNIIK